jgi:hypothetical protein
MQGTTLCARAVEDAALQAEAGQKVLDHQNAGQQTQHVDEDHDSVPQPEQV